MKKNNPLNPPEDLDLFEPGYLVTLDEIYHSHWAARKRRRMSFLREAVTDFWPQGHPSRLIHVTGTNGKGSVIHYLEHAFPAPTGSWTGPHVFDYAERFHIGGKRVEHRDITRIYREILLPYQEQFIRKHPGESLSFAELGILTALHLFDQNGVEWGMLEVGAGGRYTPLMALDVTACILTNVGADHPKTLGSQLWQRALEKAGIARRGIPFFTSADEPALGYVRKTAEAEGAPVYVLENDYIRAVYGGPPPADEPWFKQRNKGLAYRVISHFYPGFKLPEDALDAHLPARFKEVAPNIFADVAHNSNKITMLAEQLKHSFPGKRFRFLLGLTRSRDVREVFAPILPLADHIVITSASYAGQNPGELADTLKQDFDAIESIPDPQEAYAKEKQRKKPDEILVLTGSAYMIDQALNPNPYLRHLNADFGRRTSDKQ